jgi:hypothetical protein
MQTDYKKLDLFEGIVVCAIIMGLGLIGAITFSGLTTKQQSQVASAVQMLDLHEQVPEVLDTAKFVAYDVPQDFLNRFYIAFTEIGTIPSEELDSIAVLPSQIKTAYDNLLDSSGHLALEPTDSGRVLGASISNAADCDPPAQEAINNSYYFIPPEINMQKVLKVEINELSYKP